MLHQTPLVAAALELARKADVAFVGIGDLGHEAPLFVDGFVSRTELDDLRQAGAVGEICGWAFDAKGRIVEGHTNVRVASGSLPSTDTCHIVALAKGERKLAGIRGAIEGRLISGLITDEAIAAELLSH